MIVHSSLPMKSLVQGGTGGSHPCSHGGAKDLVDVCLHEIEGAMFKNEIEDSVNYIGRCDSLWVGDAFISP